MKVNKVLIANRGEIARRIALTARRLGIETVAFYSGVTPPAYLTGLVNSFVHVENETTALYLDQDKLIAVAKEYGANAIHPGFGFLSENADFARAVTGAGLIWVGPDPKAIDQMASKAAARDVAVEAGLPCVPGLQNFEIPADPAEGCPSLEEFAQRTGFPLLIKAALGGGGKGMRLVYETSELLPSAIRAKSEAISSFKDGSLICEKYIECPRHVEVQVLADHHGNVVTLGDRDCSIQRRHQKVIEEAPAPDLPDATRKQMHQAAIDLAKAVGYDSTGTVEFLVDWSPNARKQEDVPFFFLEMNTRLQVEHTVTEEVFDIDLVEWQFRVASGQELATHLTNCQPRGHSIEARLYAENVKSNYLPSPGRVAMFRPAQGPGVRWETGLDPMDEITGNFDPMIAKLVVTGPDRPSAMERMVQCLRDTVFAGPENNLTLVRLILSETKFRTEVVGTPFLQDEHDSLISLIDREESRVDQIWSVVADNPDRYVGGNNGYGEGDVVHATAQQAFLRKVVSSKSNDQIVITGSGSIDSPKIKGSAQYSLLFNRSASDSSGCVVSDLCPHGNVIYGVFDGVTRILKSSESSSDHGDGSSDPAGTPKAPVPGKVVAINCSEGQQVDEGASLFVLESMKMEFEVKASKPGVIESISVSEGEQVNAGHVLAHWKEDE